MTIKPRLLLIIGMFAFVVGVIIGFLWPQPVRVRHAVELGFWLFGVCAFLAVVLDKIDNWRWRRT